MRKAIVQRNKEVGLSRILSTSGYPSTLDGGKHYIEEGRFKMPWDQYNYTVTPGQNCLKPLVKLAQSTPAKGLT